MAALEPFQKQKILLHCVRRFHEIREELTEILIAEGGKPRKAAEAEVERLINTFQIAADAVTQVDQGRMLPLAVTAAASGYQRSEEHTSELQSRENLVCRLLLEKKKERM